ncbi:hypothetical protein BGZ88_007388 [Linnemannia elongata]|nr:hypothetical protein BGZ88_007388 [Linnemannia elongata]
MLQADLTQEHVQGFRPIHKSQPPSATSVPLNSPEVVHIGYYTDPDTNKDFIFWEDIQQAFDEALSVRNTTKVLPFVRGNDYRVLEPRRIVAVPDIVLDVVVGRESTAAEVDEMERTVQNLSPRTPPQSSCNTPRRNPAYGDVLEAIQNYNHMDVPPSAPRLQGPQTADNENKGNSSSAPTEEGHQPETATKNLLHPQDCNTVANMCLMQTMINANHGDVQAQVTLGDRYKDGREVHQDYQAAMDWYCKAAEQGHPRAQFNIGLLYDQEHDGVPQDHSKAFEWFLKSALQGYADAQAKVSQAYTNSAGVAKDNIEAMEWMVKAAENGQAGMQFSMGASYEKGHGVPQSDSRSFEWYLKSANQGFSQAQERVASAFEAGRGVPEDVTKAIEWYTKAADQGLPTAQFALGRVYQLGHCGLPKDRSKAVDWYFKAAVQGHTEAQFMLRGLYVYSKVISLDLQVQSKIKEWFIEAAEQGVAHAQCCMAFMYADGRGVDKDNFKAFAWYLKAAKQGHKAAQRLVANMYEVGRGVSKSREKSIEWAADQHHSVALACLGGVMKSNS